MRVLRRCRTAKGTRTYRWQCGMPACPLKGSAGKWPHPCQTCAKFRKCKHWEFGKCFILQEGDARIEPATPSTGGLCSIRWATRPDIRCIQPLLCCFFVKGDLNRNSQRISLPVIAGLWGQWTLQKMATFLTVADSLQRPGWARRSLASWSFDQTFKIFLFVKGPRLRLRYTSNSPISQPFAKFWFNSCRNS